MEFFPYLRLLARVLHGIWMDSGTKMADHIAFKRVFPDHEDQQGWWMYFLGHQGYYVVAHRCCVASSKGTTRIRRREVLQPVEHRAPVDTGAALVTGVVWMLEGRDGLLLS